ncbi:Triosephosphate isomerase [Dipodascopsis tothii]|uniref:Triosephosphate isomerase n=1 Tax=Dipodascopsis tothii TaxID=44089 RepID=UPI0034CDEA11
MARTFFVGGNFKMNGSKESIKTIVAGLNEASLPSDVEVVIAPPAPYLQYAAELVTAPTVTVAAQNSFDKLSGAYTGEIAVNQILDVGAKWVILGHSERRTILKETDEFIASKTDVALANGLGVILCIGETLDERNAGTTLDVVNTQMDAVIAKISDWSKVVVAYEPVWAIGTGLAATPEDAEKVHAAIREHFAAKVGAEAAAALRIIYGGSVNGKNAATFNACENIDGYLVGGASLKPEFIDIVKSRE